MVTDSTAPLVTAAADEGVPQDAAAAAVGRPVWPPPPTASDAFGAVRVANAVHTGDTSNVTAADVASSARVAAAVWPPPNAPK